MTAERLEEIKDSIDLQSKVCESIGQMDEILQEEIDLYNYVIELENMKEEIRKYIMKHLIPKNVDWEFDEVIFSDLPVERIKPIIDILNRTNKE